MKAIWKYPLPLTDTQTLLLPKRSTILTVAIQHDTITLWALVETSESEVGRTVHIYGTGREVIWPDIYIGTVFQRGLVWHVFIDPEAS